ncbi:MAG: hypothetical protein JKY17_08775 [Magnetovibrio sp.]|nr:hypothetical protein [Magnetovibrio sp.]
MDLSDLGALVADMAPLLGKLLPIPGAGIAGSLIAAKFGTKNEPSAIAAAINADPNAAFKLAEIESNNRTALESQLIQAETARILSVNQTMQTEAQSDKWWVSGWRPFWGFASGLAWAFLAICLGWAMVTGKDFGGMAAGFSTFPAIFWAIPLTILGVASHHRGKEKRHKAGEQPGRGVLDLIRGGG